MTYEEEDCGEDAGEEKEGEPVHQHVGGVVHPGHRRRKQTVQISLLCSVITFDFSGFGSIITFYK